VFALVLVLYLAGFWSWFCVRAGLGLVLGRVLVLVLRSRLLFRLVAFVALCFVDFCLDVLFRRLR